MTMVLGYIKSVLLFGIFSSVVIMAAPDKSFEKHISLAVGIIFILLIIYPVMSLLNEDSSTYISYIKNCFASESYVLSDSEKDIYADSIAIQLEEILVNAGYMIGRIKIKVDDEGNVYGISIQFNDDVNNLEALEGYIKNVFGEEVYISYE